MSLGFYNLDFVDPRGKKGGLVVGWKNGVDIEITYKCCNMINGLFLLCMALQIVIIEVLFGKQ